MVINFNLGINVNEVYPFCFVSYGTSEGFYILNVGEYKGPYKQDNTLYFPKIGDDFMFYHIGYPLEFTYRGLCNRLSNDCIDYSHAGKFWHYCRGSLGYHRYPSYAYSNLTLDTLKQVPEILRGIALVSNQTQ